MESSFGVAAKYNAPLKKCFVESVRKNWLAVAVFPDNVKYIPRILFGVSIAESSIAEAL